MRRALLAVALFAAQSVGAQVIERPIAFDTAARVMVITPPLAARIGLAAPVWPITGGYLEARLYEQMSGSIILAARRADGSIERWTLGAGELSSLRSAVESGMAVAGQLTTSDRQDVIPQPAGGAFVRKGVFASAVIWGPALGVLSDDGGAAAALELASVGTTFFITASLAKNRSISRAQSSLAWDGALKGGLVGLGLTYAALGEEGMSRRLGATGVLVGSFAGTALGYNAGSARTDGEAAAASYFSLYLPALGAGVMRASGGFQGDESRGEVVALVGTTLLGYPLGFRYARRVPYAVTSGDVGALTTASLVGILTSSVIVADDDESAELVAGVLSAGLLAGSLVGDRVLVRRFDHTDTEGWLTGLGALAGGLTALAIPTASETNEGRAYAAFAAGGALLGLAITEGIMKPREGSRRSAMGRNRASRGGTLASRIAFTPHNLLLARSFQGSPVPLLNISF
jgi:hypothetical protein